MYNHASLAGRLQYIQGGERAYAHAAIMRTVDESQANAYERQVFNAISKTARKAVRSTVNTGQSALSKAQSAAIAKAGNAAGLKAAAKVRTASRPAVTEKKPSRWTGSDEEPRCVPFAIANHLLHAQCFRPDRRLSAADIDELAGMAGPEPVIEEALWRAWLSGWPCREGREVHLADYRRVPGHRLTAALILLPLVIGYETPWGDHAALSLPGGNVVSWGVMGKLEARVEEAWELTWES
jgi:hypothetical protein